MRAMNQPSNSPLTRLKPKPEAAVTAGNGRAWRWTNQGHTKRAVDVVGQPQGDQDVADRVALAGRQIDGREHGQGRDSSMRSQPQRGSTFGPQGRPPTRPVTSFPTRP